MADGQLNDNSVQSGKGETPILLFRVKRGNLPVWKRAKHIFVLYLTFCPLHITTSNDISR